MSKFTFESNVDEEDGGNRFGDLGIMGLRLTYPEATKQAIADVVALKTSDLNYAPYHMETQQAYEYARSMYIEFYLTGEFPPRIPAKKRRYSALAPVPTFT